MKTLSTFRPRKAASRCSTVDNITPSESLTNPLTLVQIALAVKNVPFEEIVFVQYPGYPDPDDSDRVVPNYEAAEELWAALVSGEIAEVA